MATTAEVVISPDGSEVLTAQYKFDHKATIAQGDTLLQSPVPTIEQVLPSGLGPLTFGPTWVSADKRSVFVQVSALTGVDGALYKTTCTAQTTQGYTVKCRGNYVLVD